MKYQENEKTDTVRRFWYFVVERDLTHTVELFYEEDEGKDNHHPSSSS